MSDFTSSFARAIEGMLKYRAALGMSAAALANQLGRFDRYCVEFYPNDSVLEKEMVFSWLAARAGNPRNNAGTDAAAVRRLGEYLTAIGQPAYILPKGFYPAKSGFAPYIFTDAELAALFKAVDTLPHKKNSTEAATAPVLFRLIYTCGLRPNEGRELLLKNVDFDTGEIYITNTKKKKDRIVAMSGDMLALCREFRNTRLPGSICFFPRADGKPYTAAQVDRLLKKCWGDANPGISDLPNARTYDLRHRFASARLNRWLDEGANLNNKLAYLRAYMGHRELSETAYYIHILPENLVKSAGVDWAALNAILPEVCIWDE